MFHQVLDILGEKDVLFVSNFFTKRYPKNILKVHDSTPSFNFDLTWSAQFERDHCFDNNIVHYQPQ